jgi:DNA-binding transcriptional MerR regulator
LRLVTYSLEELEEELGVSARTIHFWVQSELLDGPGPGRGSRRYTDAHRDRIQVIKQLRDEGLSLADIRQRLKRESAASLRALAAQVDSVGEAPRSEASRIIQGWLAERVESRRTPAARVPPVAARTTETPGLIPALYERVPLFPGVELHVRRSLPSSSRRLVDEVMAFVRRLNKEQAR